MPKITVRPANITQPAANTVVFDSDVLRNLLVQQQQAALDWLKSRVAPVNISEISIDNQGRVVISDPQFAQVIATRLAGGADAPEAGDTACSNGAC